MSENMPEVGIVLYPGSQTAAVLGMTDLMTYAEELARGKREGNRRLMRISHWERQDEAGEPIRVFDTAPGVAGSPSILIIPPGLGPPLSREGAAQYARWLRGQHEQGTSLGSICKGAFLLGETGLMAGRTVTTHWSYEEQLLSRFPSAKVDTDRLIIDDGDIITAGGMMAWIDLSLKLVDRFLGPTIMVATARTFLVDPPGRERSYYSAFAPKLNHGDAAILKVQHWLQATECKETNLAALAA